MGFDPTYFAGTSLTLPLKSPSKGRFKVHTVFASAGGRRHAVDAMRVTEVERDLRTYCRGDYGREDRLNAMATNESTWRAGGDASTTNTPRGCAAKKGR